MRPVKLEHLPTDIAELGSEGRLRRYPGLARPRKRSMRLSPGRMTYYSSCGRKSPGLLDLKLTIPGLGPRLVPTLHRELGITSIDDLEAAARGRRGPAGQGIGGQDGDGNPSRHRDVAAKGRPGPRLTWPGPSTANWSNAWLL